MLNVFVHFIYSISSIIIISIVFFLHEPTVYFSCYSTDVGVAVAYFQFCTAHAPARGKVRGKCSTEMGRFPSVLQVMAHRMKLSKGLRDTSYP